MHRKGLLGCVDDGRGQRETVQECLLWLAVARSFFLLLLFGRCVLQKGKGRTVACSVRTVVTYCFVMRELLELSPRCFYIRRSLGMKLCSAKKKGSYTWMCLHPSVSCQMFALSQLCLYLHNTRWHMWRLWVRKARKTRWLHTAKRDWMQKDILHFTYLISGHNTYFLGIQIMW